MTKKQEQYELGLSISKNSEREIYILEIKEAERMLVIAGISIVALEILTTFLFFF